MNRGWGVALCYNHARWAGGSHRFTKVMRSDAHKSGPICFGVFEADLAGRTLRKSGVRVRLIQFSFGGRAGALSVRDSQGRCVLFALT